jgi:hypothetical protein
LGSETGDQLRSSKQEIATAEMGFNGQLAQQQYQAAHVPDGSFSSLIARTKSNQFVAFRNQCGGLAPWLGCR